MAVLLSREAGDARSRRSKGCLTCRRRGVKCAIDICEEKLASPTTAPMAAEPQKLPHGQDMRGTLTVDEKSLTASANARRGIKQISPMLHLDGFLPSHHELAIGLGP
ncbi:hypothetical protein TPAR_07436 [Tolypocladium paradoxum]|uniref:Zn(2)-C6 fungal-type domain-containing protein n=1 Tax=Tolypocladium paradoxum TaxID=94208 RepID=A0A2S4KQ90_9HYPO|nr:hypothetical protein TPAR_07436 [Tolypocladium paradoxum]